MEQLKNKANKINQQLQSQNDKFDELWKGYRVLGLLENWDKTESPITREMFNVELEKLQEKLHKHLELKNSEFDKHEFRDVLEKHIISILDLLSLRWWSINQYLKLWSNRRLDYRKNELNLRSDYKKLENERKIELFKSKTESLVKHHTELIEKQLEILTAEDELHSEMEKIYNLREKFFNLLSELFIIYIK